MKMYGFIDINRNRNNIVEATKNSDKFIKVHMALINGILSIYFAAYK